MEQRRGSTEHTYFNEPPPLSREYLSMIEVKCILTNVIGLRPHCLPRFPCRLIIPVTHVTRQLNEMIYRLEIWSSISLFARRVQRWEYDVKISQISLLSFQMDTSLKIILIIIFHIPSMRNNLRNKFREFYGKNIFKINLILGDFSCFKRKIKRSIF